MRLGGPTIKNYSDAKEWVQSVKALGYGAAYCPIDEHASSLEIANYAEAARLANISIAEVGAWSNPLSSDAKTRKEAILFCQKRLALADQIGARCCVNIAGSRGDTWDGHHATHFTQDTFDMIVETVREIIDAVMPTQTYFTLEPMPWNYPYSADSYLDLLRAIERPSFGVHLDPVNMVTSPFIYYHTSDLLRECFKKLAPYIRSCHAKDIRLAQTLTVHLDEVRPGLGDFDFATYLHELNRLPRDTPLMLEHLATDGEYLLARDHLLAVAKQEGLSFLS